MAATEPDLPPPPTPIIAGLLRLIAAGLEPIQAEPCKPCTAPMVITATGWWLLLVIDDQGAPVELTHAQPPSLLVPPWTYGCQRDDWTLGPDSRVVTPLDLLMPEQLQQLQRVLRAAPSVPEQRPIPWWDISNLIEEELLMGD